jgi:hypothetical protein
VASLIRSTGSIGWQVLFPAVLVLAVFLAALTSLSRAHGQSLGNGPVVFLEPPAATLLVGGAPVVLADVVAGVPFDPGLGSFELELAFDPDTVRLTVGEGTFLKSTGRATTCAFSLLAQTRVLYSCTSTGLQRGAWGQGVLAILYVSTARDLVLIPTTDNGRLVRIDNVRTGVGLRDVEGNFIATSDVADAVIGVHALEGDLNADCEVNIVDEQLISAHYPALLGSLNYVPFFDLQPALGDDDIDVKDLQFVFGRDKHNCQTPIPTPVVTGTPAVPTVLPVTRTPAPRSATPAPSATRTVIPRTRTPVVTRTPATTFTPPTTRTAVLTTTPAGTKTPAVTRTDVASRTPAPLRTPESVNTVLSSDRPKPGPSGLPNTGESGRLGVGAGSMVLTVMAVVIGVLTALLLWVRLHGGSDE